MSELDNLLKDYRKSPDQITDKSVPPGKYQVTVTGCAFNIQYNSIDWAFTVDQGEYAGRKIWSNNNIKSDVGKDIFLQNLIALKSYDEKKSFDDMMLSALGKECVIETTRTPRKTDPTKYYTNFVIKSCSGTALDKGIPEVPCEDKLPF
jgi:hypothetical protein